MTKEQDAGSPGIGELVRELGKLSGADRIDALRRRLPALDLAERFEVIDALGIYHHPESDSGAGSTLVETAALRRALPGLIRRYEIGSILDIPCGDFNWLRHVDLGGIEYTGADILESIAARNRRMYPDRTRRFEVLDATRDSLPPVDLVLCRDLLIHLSLEDIFRTLRNVAASGSKWFLCTHFSATSINTEILSGDFRPVNLCRAPFFLPEPRETVNERSAMAGGAYRDRAVALWPVSSIADVRFPGTAVD